MTGLLTLCGVALGAWLQFYFHQKKVREGLFKALFEEMELNYCVAKTLREKFMQTVEPFEWSPLYTLAYQNIRTSGELIVLSKDALSILENTYEMIYAHDRQVEAIANEPNPITRDRWTQGLKERIEKIRVNLEQLIEQIPKELNFLDCF